jgi:hypothetical protein
MQSRRNAVVGINPIVAKNNAIVTLHLNDKECGIERLAPHSELHGDDTPSFDRVAPHAIKRQVGLYEPIILPSKLLEDGVRHQVDDSAAINKYHGDWLPINVAPNVQQLQDLA